MDTTKNTTDSINLLSEDFNHHTEHLQVIAITERGNLILNVDTDGSYSNENVIVNDDGQICEREGRKKIGKCCAFVPANNSLGLRYLHQ